MVIILIRRFVRTDRIDLFFEAYNKQAPIDNPAFQGETLARAADAQGLPSSLRGLALHQPGSVTVINIARWASWEAFADHFSEEIEKEAVGEFDREIEAAPRQRILLDVLSGHSQDC